MHEGNGRCTARIRNRDNLTMTDIAERSMERLRPTWLTALVHDAQTAAGNIVLADADEAQAVLKEFVETIPVPVNHAESLVLRSVLLEMASRTGTHVHAGAHAAQRGDCPFVPWSLLERFWSVPTDAPREAFLRWMDEFFAQFTRSHPQSAAARVAGVLREQYQRTWPIPVLARSVHATPSQLSRQFRLEFGLSIPDYQRIVRLIHALGLVLHEKAEAAALTVGYKSKKNFYATLRHFTGLTPTGFRRLSDPRATEIIERLRLSLQSHAAARRVPRSVGDLDGQGVPTTRTSPSACNSGESWK